MLCSNVEQVGNVVAKDVGEMMKNGWVVLDVRPPGETAVVAIKGALTVSAWVMVRLLRKIKDVLKQLSLAHVKASMLRHLITRARDGDQVAFPPDVHLIVQFVI